MAVEDVDATAIANADATPVVFNNGRTVRMDLAEAVGVAEIAASSSIGSTYRLCRIPSNARVSQVLISNDACDTTGAANFGIYDTPDANSGAVVDADVFGSAVALTTAAVHTDITHESGVYGIEESEEMLWEVLGLTSDPMKEYDLVATMTAANGAGNAATLVAKVRFGQ